MHAALHREHGNTINLADHELPGVPLRCRAHETRYVFVRDVDSLFEVIGETTQSTSKHKGDARLDTDSRSNHPCGVFGAFVNTRACHSLNHLFLFLIRNTERARWPGRSNKARQHHNGQDVRHHLNELHRNIFARRQLENPLHLDRDSFSEAEQKTREQSRHWFPLAEDQRGERDEATTRSHVSRKQRRLTNREIRATHSCEDAGKQHARIPDVTHTNSSSVRSLRILTNRSETQTERRVVKNVPDNSNEHENRNRDHDW